MRLHTLRFKAMGSPCELQCHARDETTAQRAFRTARADIERLEQRYSRYRTDSFLSEMNRVALHGGTIDVDAETASLLHYADTCHRQSDGLFDITSGVLRAAWRFDSGLLPDRGHVEALLPRVGWHKVRWTRSSITFAPGMEIDLGGVVKEYAADRAAGICREHGIAHGLVNLGGDIRVIGPAPDGRPWQIGVRHPRREDATSGGLSVREGGVATSGDYERCIVVDGVRYGHILNPLTGWPVRHLASVTVIGPYCLVAGSASTIALLKEGEGPQWLQRLGFPHVWVDAAGEVGGTLSPGAGGPR